MEPPIFEHIKSIGEYVARALMRRDYVAEQVPPRQVNCRISPDAYVMLEEVADELDMSNSTVAADLLELAIAEAWEMIHPDKKEQSE